jgi:flagellar hook-associated protein 1 FlgK
MGGLFGALNSSLDAMRSLENALTVSQNNVSNASTPGYSAQVATLDALPFDTATAIGGGVKSGVTQSTDNAYADQAVRAQLSQQGNASTQSTALSSIQSLFDVTGQTGVIGALNNLFQSFSAWSATPNSTADQQAVLTAAQTLAQSFQSTANSLSQTTSQVNQQITSTVQQINSIASAIANDNAQIQQSSPPDAGIEANLQNSLNSLSQLVDTTVTFAPNGTATVLLGNGQAPLVLGTTATAISASFSANNGAQLLDASGNDITSQVSQGNLGGLLTIRNTVLPSLQGDGSQQGALNQLAQQVADRVNAILTAGQTPTGAAGTAMFDYNASDPTAVSHTLTLDPGISLSTLAPASVGPPAVSNGAALDLSNLGNSTNPADQINGQTMVQFYSAIATQLGQQASDAQTNQTLHTTLLSQAQAVQTQISGVNLDAEALQVLELQKGYDAAGKMVSVIDQLTSVLINMVT